MQSFDTFLQTSLNKPQKEAVTKTDGAMLVVAGAGSGKTRVITARMAHLILHQQIAPHTIVALTFTNKAAGEMKERLIDFLSASPLGHAYQLPFVGTFHSYCLLLLRSNPTLLPYSNFSIIDENDQRTLLKQIIKKNNLEKQFSPRQLSYQISNIKNQVKNVSAYKNPLFKEIYLAYETEKAAAHCFDFDDLLLVVLKIFQENKEFKRRFQERIKHLLIDEYQDTNGVQHTLLKEMALGQDKQVVAHSICAVGDEDQSIYSWRGAQIANMLSFQKDFAPVTMIKIEQNYRSVQPILKAANNVIEHNKQRHPKNLWSEKKAKNRILKLTCQSGYREADTIASYVQTHITNKKKKLSDIAILYRTHFQSRSIEESLIKASLPYVIIGGIRFYERKEIKDLLAYLRLIVNPFDRTSLFRVINVPTRGLGSKFEELLYDAWTKNTLLDFKQMLSHLIEDPTYKVTRTKRDAITKFLDIFAQLDHKAPPSQLLSQIIEKFEYLTYLRHAYDEGDANTKIENIQEFARSIDNFEGTSKKKTDLETFLHEIALLQEKIDKKQEEADHLQMMTLHAAKGLEFDTVIVAGLEEGLLPSSRSLQSNEEIEEERRLFYVGMTRAKERLVVTHALYRNSYGQIVDQPTSRFLMEMPDRLVHQVDLSQVHPAHTKTLLAEWLGTKFEQKITTFGPAKTYKKHKAKTKWAAKTPKTQTKRATNTGKWKKNQVVKHKTFGMGVIKKIEKITDEKFYLTIFFKSGEKKISSRFVDAI